MGRKLIFPWPFVLRSMLEPVLERPFVPLWRLLIPLFLSLTVTWFLTVPIHELLHVAGCILGGGKVGRLAVKPMYGGALLAKIFSFVAAGGKYEGQLEEFDTGGSDWCYLLTDATPYVLTVILGAPMLAWARAGGGMPALGVGMIHTLLPVASLSGDYYEMGSVILTRLVGLPQGGEVARLLRGDDLGLVFARVRGAEIEGGVLYVLGGLIVGTVLVWLTVDLSVLAALAVGGRRPGRAGGGVVRG